MLFRRPFETFVSPARDRPEIWRLLAGLGVIVVVYVLGTVLMLAAAWAVLGRPDPLVWLEAFAIPDEPGETLLLMATFTAMAAGPFLAARWLHKRRASSLFGDTKRTVRHFALAFFAVIIIYEVGLLFWALEYDSVPGLEPNTWFLLLPLSVLGLLVQTGAEEVLFRGYILQQVAARTSRWVLVYGIPSLLFGLAHFQPSLAGLYSVVGATAFGLVATDLTIRTGSIGAAWGFHFANNAVAILLLGTEGTITGLALLKTPYTAEEFVAQGAFWGLDILILVAAWAAIVWLLRRR